MIKKKGYITPVLRTHKVTIPRLLAGSGETPTGRGITNNGDGTTSVDIDNVDGEFNGWFN